MGYLSIIAGLTLFCLGQLILFIWFVISVRTKVVLLESETNLKMTTMQADIAQIRDEAIKNMKEMRDEFRRDIRHLEDSVDGKFNNISNKLDTTLAKLQESIETNIMNTTLIGTINKNLDTLTARVFEKS